MRRPLVGLAAAVAALAAACAQEEDPRPRVIVSVAPQAYVVDRLAGDRVRVEVMIPPGASPHTYEPSVARMTALQEAALYVKVGHPNFPFERAWLDRILAATPDLVVVDGSRNVAERTGDPHVWLAPRHVKFLAVEVEAALEPVLPDAVETLRANLAAFRTEIDALDREIRALLAGRRGRAFLVFHPAWGHFADAYGLEQVAIEHEHKEPDARQLAALIERARHEDVQVIFVQPQFDRSGAEMIAREVGARVETLDPLAYDWPANLRRAAPALAEALPE